MTSDGLEPINWEDKVFIDSHKAAIEKALESSDGACAAIVTACFSLAIAYGAAIALVAPKDEQAPVLVIAPFMLLALGAVVALFGKAAGISLDSFSTIDQVRTAVGDAVTEKRTASRRAVMLAAAGVITAGLVVYLAYGKPAEPVAESAEIVLSSPSRVCGGQTTSLKGGVTLNERWVIIKLDDASSTACGRVSTLTLPAASIAYTRSVP